MKTVLVYGDSQVWGRKPKDTPAAERHGFWDRWPMQLERALGSDRVRIIDHGLNGRRTVFDDPFKPYRNGAHYLDYVLHCHAPLDLVILWLGTNDFQWVHGVGPHESAQGMARLIEIVQAWKGEPDVAPPPLLVCAPPRISGATNWLSMRFREAPDKSAEQAACFAATCKDKGVAFFDASRIVALDPADGIHLSAQANQIIADALAPRVAVQLGLAS